MKAIESFPYEVDVNYEKIDIHDSAAIIKHLKPFSKDKAFFVTTHAITADALRKLINSTEQIASKTRNTFLDNLKEIEQAISKIILIASNVNKDIAEDSIRIKASRNYFREFEGSNIESSKLNFMELLGLYEVLKFHNRQFTNEWAKLKNIFGNIEVNSENHKFLQQLLIFKIYPRLNLIALVDFLIRRICFILRISNEKMKETSCTANGKYSSAIHYTFSSVFDEKITEAIIQLNELESNRKVKSQVSKNVLQNWKETIGSCFVDDLTIDCRADEVFNQGQFQMMEINDHRLHIEEIKIKKSVYMETNVGIEEKMLRRYIVRSLITEIPVEEKLKQYDLFLKEYFNLQMSSVTVHLPTLNPDEQKLFMYHVAPTYFFRIIINHMQESRTGFIHRFAPKNTIVRELPVEYIRLALSHWWDNSIYKKISRVEKNSKEKYVKYVQLLAKFWEKDEQNVVNHINANLQAQRAFELHNLDVLRPFLEQELSYLFYSLYVRFLGQDFIYYYTKRKHKQHIPSSPQKDHFRAKNKEKKQNLSNTHVKTMDVKHALNK